ncbi:hypothetical protein QTP88_010615 [Uroleucon formosanum]
MDSKWTAERDAEAVKILTDDASVNKDRRYYHVRQKFDLIEVAGVRRVRRKRDQRIMSVVDSFHSIIRDIHVASGHKSETKTHKKIMEHYSNVPMADVKTHIVNCERCAEKSKKKSTRGVVVRPILSSSLNERGQVDLVDFQSLPDVAKEQLHIFLTFGAPHVLQSNNGREFTAGIITELASMWPDLILVNGRPRYPQSQGSVKRGKLKDSLVVWMRDNKTAAWSYGLAFVQWGVNTTYHEAIKMTPYKSVFGQKARMGLATKVLREVLENIMTGTLEEDIPPKTNNDIDEAVNLFASNIQTSAWESAQPTQSHTYNMIIPLYIRSLIAQKRRARCLWQRSKYPTDKSNYNMLAQKLKRTLANYRNKSYTNHLESLTTKDGSLWKATKQLLRIRNPPAILHNVNGNWVHSDEDKANIFANHLVDSFQPHNTILLPEKINIVELFLNLPLQMSLPPKHISSAEVRYLISKLSRKKSPGYDLITSEILNQLPKKVIFGFRTKHSTIHQIHRIVDKISFSLEKKQYCTGAFLDVSQAFDRVWHAGLLFKLKLILPSTYYLILKSYLEDRFFSVRYGSFISSSKPINAGVLQGAVTAPLLFNIFVSDQPTLPTSLIADFADDKAIITNSHDPSVASSHIQEHLSLFEKWYKE